MAHCKKFKRTSKVFFILLLSLAMGACSSLGSSNKDEFKGKSAQELYTDAEKAMAEGNYRTAIKTYEALEARYPFGKEVEQAQLDVIYAYYKDGDTASTLAAADQYIHLYPRSPNVDYAYYMKGVANFKAGRTFLQRYLPVDMAQRDLTTTQDSFEDFRKLLEMFPNSQYAPDARQRMVYLRDLLASHEIMVANFYMSRHGFVAAANRADYVVSHYEGAPEVVDALAIQVRAYNALGLNNRADTALRLIQMNYPHSKQLTELNAELKKDEKKQKA